MDDRTEADIRREATVATYRVIARDLARKIEGAGPPATDLQRGAMLALTMLISDLNDAADLTDLPVFEGRSTPDDDQLRPVAPAARGAAHHPGKQRTAGVAAGGVGGCGAVPHHRGARFQRTVDHPDQLGHRDQAVRLLPHRRRAAAGVV
jgi:hypothetical protein